MLETIARETYQKYCVNLFAAQLARIINPNFITLLAVLFGLSIPILLIKNHPDIAVLMLLLSGYCDTLDGTIARFQNKTSDFGTILDIMGDRIVECAVIFGLYMVDPQARGTIAFGMLISIILCITSFLVVGIFTQNNGQKNFHYSPGLMERAEAFIFFIAMILMPSYFNQLGLTFIILVCWTAFRRIVNFKNLPHQKFH
jgi:phosphatidylglycerophosphate synthase